ncbi:MAG: cation-translocating P-type ATPase [Acidobacteriota bacterium]
MASSEPKRRAALPRRTGLSSTEAERRLAEVGPNEIRRERATTASTLATRQFASPVIWLLLGATVVSAAVGEWLDAMAIGAIVLINAAIGFLQEHRAERAVMALRSMTAPRARVLRDGHGVVVSAATVVPGDLLVLEAGDVAAADAHLLTAHALTTNEAPLTGESTPVQKSTEPTAPGTALAERHDFVFMGTAIATGTGLGDVVATGMHTELGGIAQLLATAEDTETPLQRRLARVSQTLLYICGGIVVLVALAGLLRGWSPMEAFMAAVSLAVAAIPEGLPAVVTIALAIGVQRMAARHVLIRRLPAVETLGCATVICTDKTGTLTTGVMRVRELWGRDHERLLWAGAACSDAELGRDGRRAIGDPTELAILMAAAERGIHREEIEAANPRVAEIPFDPVQKRMSVARADGFLYIKGALESVLPLCVAGVDDAVDAHAQLAERGLRILAVAVSPAGADRQATLLGLIGMADPPRPEVIDAVAAAAAAGITTVMITGDHPVTARAIARELGILTSADAPAGLVHARATPENKIAIVREWKRRGAIVAMTGDGVNDAPALREAHIGIAMGLTGTEVTREASDMVLADDNFASIVAAIREGRGIFDNIRKTLVYLLSGNTAELTVMLVAAVGGLPLPLLPLHLLWINVVTDGLPAIALVFDPPEEDVLGRPPRHPDEPMLGRAQWRFVVTIGLLEAAATLGVFVWALNARGLPEARGLTFSTLVFGELFRAFAARSSTRLFWEVGAFTNLRLLTAVLCSMLLQLGLHQLPAARAVFAIGPLSAADAALTLLVALGPVTVIEVSKLFHRWRARQKSAEHPIPPERL